MIHNHWIIIKYFMLMTCLLLLLYSIQVLNLSNSRPVDENYIFATPKNFTNTTTSTIKYTTRSTTRPTIRSIIKWIPLSTEVSRMSTKGSFYYRGPRTCKLVVCSIGNLGNQIWEYMSLFVVWRKFVEYNYLPYIQHDMWENLKVLFPKLSILPRSYGICDNNHDDRIISKTETLTKYTSWFTNSEHCQDIVLEQYSSRYEEIIEYGLKDIREEMRYSAKLIKSCQKTLHSYKNRLGFENETVTFIGMHYRGTDYLKHLEINYGDRHLIIPDHRYYVRAMRYFQGRYPNVIFILISIDEDWLSENLPHILTVGPVIVNPYYDDRVHDLVLLSSCNHSIINYGTFGTTAALFSGGETIVYDLKMPLDHRGTTLAMGIAKILKNWTLMT